MPKLDLTDEQILEVRRAKLKIAAKYRAELGFEQNLERIDHRLDVIEPAQAAVDELVAAGNTPYEIAEGV